MRLSDIDAEAVRQAVNAIEEDTFLTKGVWEKEPAQRAHAQWEHEERNAYRSLLGKHLARNSTDLRIENLVVDGQLARWRKV
jgi:hypothetical protein